MSWREETELYNLTEYLDTDDLVCLVVGRGLRGYGDIEPLSVLGLGRWIGGHSDRWEWSREELKKCHGSDLAAIYLALKHCGELPVKVRKWDGKTWGIVP